MKTLIQKIIAKVLFGFSSRIWSMQIMQKLRF